MEPTSQQTPPPSSETTKQTFSSLPTLAQNVSQPKYSRRSLFASAAVFLVIMGYFTYASYTVASSFTGPILIGAIVISLGVSIVFYFVYWFVSIIGRKFGTVYSVIIWLILIGLLAGWYTSPSKQPVLNPSGPIQEDSIYLPPGTQLSEIPSYIQVDKSRIVNIPDGGMSIPKSAFKFSMSYEDCLKTTDLDAQKGCANKYSIERKDASLCKSLVHSNDPDMAGLITIYEEECIAQYAFVNMEASLCDTITNEFIASINCFGNIVAQIKNPDQCSIVFKKEIEVKDCVAEVAKNQQLKK